MYDTESIRERVEGYFRHRYAGLGGGDGRIFERFCMGRRMEGEEKRYLMELERARDLGLMYAEWELGIDFISIKVRCGQAWVEVEESHRVVFGLARHTRSSMGGLLHRLKLRKRKGVWYIVKHTYQDERGAYLKGKRRGLNIKFDWSSLIKKGKDAATARMQLYDREAGVRYAHRWALGRNPLYHDFEGLGGDCTNFCSQVLHAGGCPMNGDKWNGWYYYGLNNRSPSWTGVEPLYRFLKTNNSAGPLGEEVSAAGIMPGDIIQLDFSHDDVYNHCLVVVSNPQPGDMNKILIACHTIDRDNYPLVYYDWRDIRFLHIKGHNGTGTRLPSRV